MKVQNTNNQQSFGRWSADTRKMNPVQMKLIAMNILAHDDVFMGLKVAVSGKKDKLLYDISHLYEKGLKVFRRKVVYTYPTPAELIGDNEIQEASSALREGLQSARKFFLKTRAERKVPKTKLIDGGTRAQRELASHDRKKRIIKEITTDLKVISEAAERESAEKELEEAIALKARFYQK